MQTNQSDQLRANSNRFRATHWVQCQTGSRSSRSSHRLYSIRIISEMLTSTTLPKQSRPSNNLMPTFGHFSLQNISAWSAPAWVCVPLHVHLQNQILPGCHNFKGVFEGSGLVLRLMRGLFGYASLGYGLGMNCILLTEMPKTVKCCPMSWNAVELICSIFSHPFLSANTCRLYNTS